ncbi:subunit of the Arp2/3 complex [Cadophora gregata f. sp. sojae]|nr:subunit of the Arp2/3 complex [Cadophora gregata f. sp. sojae]
MPAYNSIFNPDSSPPTSTNIGNFPLLPLRTRVRGPAYTLPLDASLPAHLSPEPDSESYDALDEVLSLFRANTFFRNFEIQGPADRLLIYGILWVSECLGKIRPGMSGREAQKEVQNIALDTNFSIPGDPGFPLNQVRFLPTTSPAFPTLPSQHLHHQYNLSNTSFLIDVQPSHQPPRSRSPSPIPLSSPTGTRDSIAG